MVCPYLKNKGSAVRFCLWPPITIRVFSLLNSKKTKWSQKWQHRKFVNDKIFEIPENPDLAIDVVKNNAKKSAKMIFNLIFSDK